MCSAPKGRSVLLKERMWEDGLYQIAPRHRRVSYQAQHLNDRVRRRHFLLLSDPVRQRFERTLLTCDSERIVGEQRSHQLGRQRGKAGIASQLFEMDSYQALRRGTYACGTEPICHSQAFETV